MNSTSVLSRPSSNVARMLHDSSQHELRRLEVVETESEVILTGIVPSFYLKSLAQETVRCVLGERRLRNQIVVSKN